MTLDFLDAAFVSQWWTATEPAADESCPAVHAGPVAAADDAPAPTAGSDDDLVARLIAAATAEWAALADAAVAARARGRRCIAVVGCERGAGCTTLAEGLVRVLHGRGRDAIRCGPTAIPAHGPTHDRRITIVDAGVWFPPGRISRPRLLVASSGCDAAILVVRSGRVAPAAWSTALEAIGVEPLGEVISFAPTVEPTP